jgi:glycosyltransferase involved in cell wall biosynthesis
MRIVLITAGTGSFHCGTCMRDNALVAELCRMGHDAVMVPLYLPTILDEAPASPEVPLFYGGINVYLQQKSSLFRKSPRALDKLLDSPGILKAAANRAGMTSARELGDITISMLKGEEGLQVKELDRLVEWLKEEIKPEIVCLSNALLVGLARRIKERTGAKIVCTLQGEDTFLDSLPEPWGAQSWQIIRERGVEIDAFTAVSKYHGNLMRERAKLPAERMNVVHNGISFDGFGPAPTPPESPVLGYLARMSPSKGLEALVEAFIALKKSGKHNNVRLAIAGSQNSGDAKFAAGLQGRLDSMGLAQDASFHPNVSREEKIRFLQCLTVFSVPATYGESFGLYVVEALACGVPVVQPRHAAFPEIIEATGGGILYNPDEPGALPAAIEQLLDDPVKAQALGEQGRKAVLEKFSAQVMARETMKVFEAALYINT